MEDKQLNFDQPLLFVRRGSSTAILPDYGGKKTNNSIPIVPYLPYYKSELKSGPVSNPGIVPFQWEQIPGRPKDENRPQRMALEYSPLAPKLPPGRIMNHALKDSSATKPQAENDLTSSPDVSSLDKNVMALEKYEEKMEENTSTVEDDDSIYVDALDTLSRSESFFLNCSVSGVSGLDGPDIKPSRTLSDPQTRDFMMDRFLPAAKAVAFEMPQFASRKQPSVKEQCGPVKKLITWDMKSPQCYLPPSTQDEGAEAEEEDEKEDSDETENLSAKVCGLFPRFCLLNPIPGMRDQVWVPISSVRRVRRKPASSWPCSDSVNKDKRAATFFKIPTTAVHKYEADDKANNLNGRLYKTTCQSDSRKLDKSYKHGHVIRNGRAPYSNVLLTSFFGEEKGLLGIPDEGKFSRTGKHCSLEKGYKKFQKLLANLKAEEDSDNANPTIEKTLYIDSMQMTESQSLNSSFLSESRGTTDSRRRTTSVDYSLQDKYLCCADGKTISQSRDFDNVDCNVSSCIDISSQEMQKQEEFQQNQDLKLDSDASGCLKLPEDHKPAMDVQHLTNTDTKEATYDSSLPILPPPLPKSPSESWLSRTLPSISLRNPSSKSHLSALWQGNLAARPSPAYQKWETIVKSSNSQHTHLQLPRALAPITEN